MHFHIVEIYIQSNNGTEIALYGRHKSDRVGKIKYFVCGQKINNKDKFKVNLPKKIIIFEKKKKNV